MYALCILYIGKTLRASVRAANDRSLGEVGPLLHWISW